MMILRFGGLIAIFFLTFHPLFGQKDQCDPSTLCTMEYYLHHVKITDSENSPVFLDEFFSKNLDTGKVLVKWKYDNNDFNNNIDVFRGYAHYLLLGDNFREDKINQFGTTVRFIGKQKGKVIINRDFKVGHNCCHTIILEGDLAIQIPVKFPDSYKAVLVNPESPAQFPGGLKALFEYLEKENQCVQKQTTIMGSVYVRFTVKKDGSLTDVEVVRGMESLCPECNEEALRLIKDMPKWKPRYFYGKPVDSEHVIPIKFGSY